MVQMRDSVCRRTNGTDANRDGGCNLTVNSGNDRAETGCRPLRSGVLKEQKNDLEAQLGRLVVYANSQGWGYKICGGSWLRSEWTPSKAYEPSGRSAGVSSGASRPAYTVRRSVESTLPAHGRKLIMIDS